MWKKRLIVIVAVFIVLRVLAAVLDVSPSSTPDPSLPPDEPALIPAVPIQDVIAPAFAFEDPLAQKAYGYFCELTQIPRGSGNEWGVSNYLVEFANKNGLKVSQGSSLNVFVSKPGSAGRENEPPLILQTHMDMVCEKNEGVGHDFFSDPLTLVTEGGWIRAQGTTLGADSGGGLAIIMAVLAAPNLSHPPLEAIITVAEETNMGGASSFDTSRLKGKRLINLDGEDDGVLTVSSAGSASGEVRISIKTGPTPDGFAAYKLTVKGLTGGHSGLDINKGRANAIILMAHLLDTLDDGTIHLTGIEGGSAYNAIPRECMAELLFAESNFGEIRTKVMENEAAFKAGYPNEDNLTLALEKTATSNNVMSHDSFRKVLDCILTTPNGVQTMSPDIEGLVQTSNNLSTISSSGGTVILSYFLRGFEAEDLKLLAEKMELAAKGAGAIATVSQGSSGWKYQADSPLRDIMAAVYEDMYGKAPKISGVHAGLECAIFARKMPGSDFISIGPTIENAHSPDERMDLASFERTCTYLARVLEAL